MITDESETFDEVCKTAYREKMAEPYTWARLSDRIIWRNAFIMTLYQVGFVVAVYYYVFGLFSVPVKRWTIIWIFVVGWSSALGTTAGAHRLWTHRSYKAKLPLRILLMILYAMMGLYSLYFWVRDHRVHHKYSETDADPHNAKRGFMFSHIGWIVMKRHPECLRRIREVDMSDIEADPVVMFQRKYQTVLRVLLCYVVPTAIPVIFWKETILHAILTQCVIRFILFMHMMFTVNSVSHLWGNRPYNRFINAADIPIVSLLVVGDGSHNYHHTFPWDYKTSELPYMNFNSTTLFIHAMVKIGWAYDCREPSPEFVEKVINRIGYKSEVGKGY